MSQSRDRSKDLLDAYYDPELKKAGPCKFCGNTLLAMAESSPAPIIPRPTWRILCTRCGGLGPCGASKAMAVTYWNGHFERVITLPELDIF